jgi:hypothetical protein
MSEMQAKSGATGLVAWWRVRGRGLLVTVAITSLLLVVLGWMTGLRAAMHGAFLAVAAVALLPFVLVSGGLLIVMAIGLVMGLASGAAADHAVGLADASELVVGGGWSFGARYYRFIGRRRHPVFWGIPAGTLFGALVLWALLATFVLPGEARTVRLLLDTKARIDRAYRDTSEFPRPDEEGHVASEAGTVALDGFGRPLHYEVSGRWKLASWVLVSSGFDGKTGTDDDLCISGATRIAERVAPILKRIGEGTASTKDDLAGIRALTCPAK